MEYKIITTKLGSSPDQKELETLVNNSIKEGWTPLGGPIVLEYPQRCTVLFKLGQALTK